jgi:hypothetical protein
LIIHTGKVVIAAVGIVLIAFGIFASMKSPTSELDGEKYGVTITNPKPGESVSIVNVVGKINKRIPPGYTLMILRIYPEFGNGFIPLKDAVLDPDKKGWTAFSCDIGGKRKDKRAFGVYLVGPSGQALFRYFREATTEHNITKERLETHPGEKANYLPLIQEKTRDMIKCAEVPVVCD